MVIDVDKAVVMLLSELAKAELKHPHFPRDLIYKTNILSEEAGEAAQAANELCEGIGSMEAYIKEVKQAGAMALRILITLEDATWEPQSK